MLEVARTATSKPSSTMSTSRPVKMMSRCIRWCFGPPQRRNKRSHSCFMIETTILALTACTKSHFIISKVALATLPNLFCELLP